MGFADPCLSDVFPPFSRASGTAVELRRRSLQGPLALGPPSLSYGLRLGQGCLSRLSGTAGLSMPPPLPPAPRALPKLLCRTLAAQAPHPPEVREAAQRWERLPPSSVGAVSTGPGIGSGSVELEDDQNPSQKPLGRQGPAPHNPYQRPTLDPVAKRAVYLQEGDGALSSEFKQQVADLMQEEGEWARGMSGRAGAGTFLDRVCCAGAGGAG